MSRDFGILLSNLERSVISLAVAAYLDRHWLQMREAGRTELHNILDRFAVPAQDLVDTERALGLRT